MGRFTPPTFNPARSIAQGSVCQHCRILMRKPAGHPACCDPCAIFGPAEPWAPKPKAKPKSRRKRKSKGVTHASHDK